MKTYKFTTKIADDGKIKIPDQPHLSREEVDIIVIPRSERSTAAQSAESFVKKWSGFMDIDDTDRSKYDYLLKKYK